MSEKDYLTTLLAKYLMPRGTPMNTFGYSSFNVNIPSNELALFIVKRGKKYLMLVSKKNSPLRMF